MWLNINLGKAQCVDIKIPSKSKLKTAKKLPEIIIGMLPHCNFTTQNTTVKYLNKIQIARQHRR